MKVLVTGAAGFVGQALCLHLRQKGYGLRQAVRNRSGDSHAQPVQTVVSGEIGPSTDWAACLDGMDAVVHLAARVHRIRDTAADALADFRSVNVEGTCCLAAAVRRAGVSRLVLLSSAKVHGDSGERPFTERDLLRPGDPYAISKLEAEMALRDTLSGSPVQWTILRPPLVYGAGVKANFLTLTRAVARGVPLPLGAVDNRRSLLYVGNLADAIERCLNVPEAAGRTFLVSDGEDVSTPELIRRLARALGVKARLIRVPARMLRVAGRLIGRSAAVDRLLGSLQIDCSELERTLHWRPAFTLDQGLAHTARWYLDRVA